MRWLASDDDGATAEYPVSLTEYQDASRRWVLVTLCEGVDPSRLLEGLERAEATLDALDGY